MGPIRRGLPEVWVFERGRNGPRGPLLGQAGCAGRPLGSLLLGLCLLACSSSNGESNDVQAAPSEPRDGDQAGPTEAPTRCGDGHFASTDPDARCQPWQTCKPGAYIATAGTDTTDRVCQACPSGTFSDAPDVELCQAWRDCTAGEYVAVPGTDTLDQVCAVCAAGTFSASENTSECQPLSECPAGSQLSQASPTTDRDRVCEACSVGSHCRGGKAPAVPCAPGSWDHDQDPATACVSQTGCLAGEAVSAAGDDHTDRSCETCSDGTFSTTENAARCDPWSNCGPGTLVESTGTTTTDRVCIACDGMHYSDAENLTACVPRGSCAAGSEQTDPGSATAPVACAACTPGEYCAGGQAAKLACASGTFDDDLDPQTPCQDQQDCDAGSFIAEAGDATSDRTCAACGAGSFSTELNATACTAFTTCVAGEFVVADGTNASDRDCEACPPESFSSADNETDCTPWTPCPIGYVEATPGTAQSDRTCERAYPIRVSIASDGSEGSANSFTPAISGDGRYVAFYSHATNLVPGDSNGFQDVFVHDAEAGLTARVSVASHGAQANGDSSGRPAMSADGRYVAFVSLATNLVSGDTNLRQDVFVHDLISGVTARVSVASDGSQADADAFSPSISGDGRYVAFHSAATNLVPGDSNADFDVFVHDRTTGQTVRASVSDGDLQANGRSFSASLSADGSRLAFHSFATNLVAGDSNGSADVFVRDLSAGTTQRVSLASDGSQGNGGSVEPSLSADGLHVAFYASATNLVAGDTNGTTDVFVRHLQTAQTERASVSTAGVQTNSDALYASISGDGSKVAFRSHASNLVAGDTNGMGDIFVRDLTLGTTVRVSQRVDGTQANATSEHPALALGGGFVAFYSSATNLVAADTNGALDIFIARAR